MSDGGVTSSLPRLGGWFWLTRGRSVGRASGWTNGRSVRLLVGSPFGPFQKLLATLPERRWQSGLVTGMNIRTNKSIVGHYGRQDLLALLFFFNFGKVRYL